MTAETPPQSFYDAVGGEPTFRRIVARFYALVADDEILRPLYPEEDLGPAEERLRLFLIQRWGGPPSYTQLRGRQGLAARHMRFRIAREHRDAWLGAMRVAVDEAGLTPAHSEQLWGYLETVAWNLTTHASPAAARPATSASDGAAGLRLIHVPGRSTATAAPNAAGATAERAAPPGASASPGGARAARARPPTGS